jgi:hypothetical protein
MEAFSLKATKKSIEGGSHADRDAQFQYTNRIGKAFEAKGQSVISVDCKKKELIGNAQEQGERIASQSAPLRRVYACCRSATPLVLKWLKQRLTLHRKVARDSSMT